MSTQKPRASVRLSDLLLTGLQGLTSRPGRTVLTGLGIAIGIASMVAVLGISSSSRADLLAEIDRLGTNLLQVRPGTDGLGADVALPASSTQMVGRIGPVDAASSTSELNTQVQRNEFTTDRNGLDVFAVEPDLFETLNANVDQGRLFDQDTSSFPIVVLGSVAAERLGIQSLEGSPTVTIAGRAFAVGAILESLPLHPEIDRSVMIGSTVAENLLGAELVPTTIYLRSAPEQVEAVRSIVARTVNPVTPNAVRVSRPSDALEARASVDTNLRNLLLGLGTVALIVGGIGIANVMVISVLERRTEIGLRRALGAKRRHIAAQFVVESAALSLLGGIAGAALGAAITIGYVQQRGWTLDLPVAGFGLAIVASLALGAVVGVYPAIRASRLDPAEAVRPGGG